MTEPLDITSLVAEPADMPPPEHVKPNHKASSKTKDRPGIFGGNRQQTRKPDPPNKPGQFIGPLTDFYMGAAMVLMPFQPDLALTIMGPSGPPTEDVPEPPTVAENCARAWDEAAQRSPALRRFLDGFLTASAWSGVLMAHVPILMVLLSRQFAKRQVPEHLLRNFGASVNFGEPEPAPA